MAVLQSETEYLEKEAAQARAAIDQTLKELTHTVGQAANPAVWTRQYPWAAVGIAAAGGLLGAALLKGSDLSSAPAELQKQWRRQQRRVSRHARALREVYAELAGDTEGSPPAWVGLVRPFRRAAIRMLKLSLRGALGAAFSAGTAAAVAHAESQEPTADPQGI